MHRLFLLLGSLVWLSAAGALSLPVSSFAQVSDEGASYSARWQRELDRARSVVETDKIPPQWFGDIRQKLLDVELEARESIRKDQGALDNAKSLLQALGPSPEPNHAAEPADIAQERKRLIEQIGLLEGRIKQADYAIARAESLRAAMLANDRQRMTRELFSSGPTLFERNFWTALDQAVAPFAATALGRAWRAGIFHASLTGGEGLTAKILGVLAVGLLCGFGLLFLIRGRYVASLRRDLKPSSTRKISVVILDTLALVVFFTCVGFALYRGLYWLIGDSGTSQDFALFYFADAAFVGIVTAVILYRFFIISLARSNPLWRVLPLSDTAVAALQLPLALLFLLVASSEFALRLFDNWDQSSFAPVEHAVTLGLVFLFAVLALRLTAANCLQASDEADTPLRGVRLLFPAILRLATLVALLAALGGYYDLSAYMARGVGFSFLIIGLFFLLRRWIREGLPRIFTEKGRRALQLRIRFGLEEDDAARLAFWLGAALQTVLFLSLATILLLIWRIPEYAIGDFWRRLAVGIKFGATTIAPADVGIALLVFFLGLYITRLTKKTLRERVLPQTRLNRGLRDSISTGVGYLGIVLALIFGVTTLGVDLSNIALIAGALSVGIGFGLQSIVNNFISGIILLIERPLKVGDWVIIGNNEGFVRRISVRSTEIETFRQSAAIIPNAEILSTAVINLTHNDKKGRVEVTVGVDYASDSERVRDILLKCAREQTDIDAYPAPQVLFKDFGADAMIFQLRAFISNIENRIRVESDLRFSIDRAFREAKIVIPWAQHEISFRDIDKLAALFTRNNPPQ